MLDDIRNIPRQGKAFIVVFTLIVSAYFVFVGVNQHMSYERWREEHPYSNVEMVTLMDGKKISKDVLEEAKARYRAEHPEEYEIVYTTEKKPKEEEPFYNQIGDDGNWIVDSGVDDG